MPATPIPVNTITEQTGLVPVTQIAVDATSGGTVNNGQTVYLSMTNTGGSSATVSVAYARPVDGQTVPPRTYTIPAAGKLLAGVFPASLFGSTLAVSASAVTVTFAAYQLG